MKLARPDIRHARIVLAGPPGGLDGDGDGLLPALRRRGLHAHWLPWDDPDAARADLVILRAAPDYHERLDEFLAWTRGVAQLLNPPDVIAWNADQRYLLDLDQAGVPTLSGGHVSASADQTALIFLGGEQSHAFTAGSAAEPDFEFWDLGHAALRAAAAQVGIPSAELLSARAEVTGEPGDVRLIGLDLVAPSLGWLRLAPAARDLAQRRFAVCVESALDRLGLGPLSLG